MEFRLLGPLEVWDGQGGVMSLGGGKQRALLAILLLHANQVVPADRLIDELWGEDPPGTANNVLQVYIGQLRRALQPERTQRGPDELIVTRPGGYLLRVAEGELDLERCQRLAKEGRAALSDDPRAAARLLRQALDLWRGQPLADVEFASLAGEAARLDELRFTVLESRIEADLARGAPAEVVGELEALGVSHPLRERLRAHWMLALYRSGRQAEALEVFRETKRLLSDELGIDPSPELEKLELAILRHDPNLQNPTAEVFASARPSPEPSTALAPTLFAPREERKVVTVLVAGLIRNPSGGGQPDLDPENVRQLLSPAFARLQTELERHGGKVEQSMGGSVMALFGVPVSHEDDPERAVRAALAIRDWLRSEQPLQVQIAVNTGEVLVTLGASATTVSGEVINNTARVHAAAPANAVLVGAATHRATAEVVTYRQAEFLAVRGIREPVPMWTAIDAAHRAGQRRRSDAPFVGREEELALLVRAFERVTREHICVLATIVGPPGIGKSRLAEELALSAGRRARVVIGRCLPYGEGITYWPLAEIVNDVGGTDLPAAVAEAIGAEASVVSERIAAAIGSGDSPGSAADIFWAFRKLFEGLAHDRPLIVVIDDLHWAEPTLLDLLEYLTGFASGAPILLVCLARPELFESRPAWAVPRPNALLVALQPISDTDAGTLIANLMTQDLSKEAWVRVTRAAEGNPLFIEQLLALNADAKPGNGSILVPPTMQALLAARIDRLDASDRAVIERASVEGRSFHRSAVAELLDESSRASVGASLLSLARKEFIEAGHTLFARDDGFRFAHILIRDAAYEAVPKQLRAELHEHFAKWLERMLGERATEYEEILGYHLEQAHGYLVELGRRAEARRLGELAGQRLAPAGVRALGRGDVPAAVNLLTRAADLLPLDDARRLDLLAELGIALTEAGELAKAELTLQEAAERAAPTANDIASYRTTIARLVLGAWTGADANDEAIARAEEAVASGNRLGDELGLARAWHLLGMQRMWGRGDSAAADAAFQQALTHAGRAGAQREESVTLQWVIINSWFGVTGGSEGMRRCHDILRRSTSRSVEATARVELACFLAMMGRFDEAWVSFGHGRDLLEDMGQNLMVAGISQEYFDIAMLAGDPAAAEQHLRSACETLERMGEKGYLATRLGCLAEAVYRQGRYAEAEQITVRVEAEAALDPSDIDLPIRWRTVRAKVLARRGDHSAAETLAREAVSLIARTDWLNYRAGVHEDLSEVLLQAGRVEEAQAALNEAMHLYERKENVVAARRLRARLAEAPPWEPGRSSESSGEFL